MPTWRHSAYGICITLSLVALSFLFQPTTSVSVTPLLAKPAPTWTSVGFPDSLVQTGDLIVRTGTSFFSNELRKFSRRDPTYSHCGWVVRDSSDRLWVYHAIGGTDNPDNSLRKDPIAKFCDAKDIRQFALFRYTIPDQDKWKATQLADSLYQVRTPFDLSFDLQDDSELYCAEFIWKILKETANRAEFISLSRLQDKDYVGIDDLYLHDHCTKIYEYAYQ